MNFKAFTTIEPKLREVIPILTLLFFSYCGFMKFLHMRSFRSLLLFYVRSKEVSSILSILIGCSEIVLALLLVFRKTQQLALCLGLLYFISFLVLLILTPNTPHNLGGILNYLSYKQLLIFSSFSVIVIAYTILKIERY